MKNRRNYYRILNVQPDAPPEVIRSSYRTMMQRMRMHPDLGGDSGAAAIVNEAYRILMDEDQRRAYDRDHRDSEWARHTRWFRGGDASGGEVAGRCHFCHFLHVDCAFPQPPERCVNCRSPLGSMRLPARGDNDRRGVMRLARECDLNLFTHWPQAIRLGARVLDLSPAGLRLHCDGELARGQVIKLESELFDAVACVVRAGGGNRSDAGARFLSVRFAHSRGTFVACRA